MPTVAQHILSALKSSGVSRVYGLPGDSLNGFTDAMRRDGGITWEHVRHEEAAAFAAGARGRADRRAGGLRRQLRAGQPAPDQRPVSTPTAAGCRCWRSRRTSRRSRSAPPTSRRRIRRSCSASAASTASWSASPSRCPRVMEIAMRTAIEQRRGRGGRHPGRSVLAPMPVRRHDDRRCRQAGLGDPPGRRLARGRGRRAQRREPGDHPGRGRMRGRARRSSSRLRRAPAGPDRARHARQGVRRVRQPASTSA